MPIRILSVVNFFGWSFYVSFPVSIGHCDIPLPCEIPPPTSEESWQMRRCSISFCHYPLIIFCQPLFSHPFDSLHTKFFSTDCICPYFCCEHIIRIRFLNPFHPNLNILWIGLFNSFPTKSNRLYTLTHLIRALCYLPIDIPTIW